MLLALVNGMQAQTMLTGQLTGTSGQPLVGASVTVAETETAAPLAFAISDAQGRFEIQVSTTTTQLWLSVRSLGYAPQRRQIANQSQQIQITLVEQALELEEVVLKHSPITQHGDTISYDVASFANTQDRSIADVLKRMPGIDILADGRVLYQGKPINKFYIEGLDLLEGKYNLASKNLQHKEVDKVQILENHQPIKILDGVAFSDKAALNIKLKNQHSFTGQAELGLGALPLLWETNITPMLFSKKQQMLSTYQSNNSGYNIAEQLKTLTIEDLLEQKLVEEKQDWLAIQTLNTPNFADNRWLDNQTRLLSTNVLRKLGKDYELRLNAAYLNDLQWQEGFNQTLLFTSTDTFGLREEQYNRQHIHSVETDLTLQRNASNKYLKNSLQFQGYWDSQQGSLLLNEQAITQQLSNPYFRLSNRFKSIRPWGKQLITLKSYVSLSQTPQSLVVSPGQFEVALNTGNPYERLRQDVLLKRLYTDNSLGFSRTWKTFVFSPRVGFVIENQALNTELLVNEQSQAAPDFANRLQWLHSSCYAAIQTQFRHKKWRMELDLPLNWHLYHLQDRSLEAGQALSQLTFEPKANVVFESMFWKLNLTTGLGNQFGVVQELYYAFLLKDYRQLQRINTALPERLNHNLGAAVTYKNPLKALFWNLSYTYNLTRQNLLFVTNIDTNGAITLEALEQGNFQTTQLLVFRANKYVNRWNANVGIGTNFMTSSLEQVLNERLANIYNQSLQLHAKLNLDLTQWLSTELKSSWQIARNRIDDSPNNTAVLQSQLFQLHIYPKEKHYIGLNTEYIQNTLFSENTQNLFADLTYRHTFWGTKIDFEIQWRNIFNNLSYQTLHIEAFRYIETNFMLRPSQVLAKLRFSL